MSKGFVSALLAQVRDNTQPYGGNLHSKRTSNERKAMTTLESREDAANGSLRTTVRSIALAIVFVSPGFLLRLLLNLLADVKISLLSASILNFGLAAFGALVVFPKVLKQPFGELPLADYRRRLGFYWPEKPWRHVALGIVLALCTLSGMLASSLLTGRYVLDWRTIDLEHLVFSLNPGVWEEFFFRGIIMLVLLQRMLTHKQAALIQIVLFGLTHIKGFAIWAWVDVLSVMIMAVAFTYAAYKTRTLIAGIVFHFIHDSLLSVVQVPAGEYIGFRENIIFFTLLWLMVGVACWVVKAATERLGVRSQAELYEAGSEVIRISFGTP